MELLVSSSRERIEQAKADLARRRIPLPPGDSEERIPLPPSPDEAPNPMSRDLSGDAQGVEPPGRFFGGSRGASSSDASRLLHG